MPKRDPSTSITQLVKTVAKEVVSDYFYETEVIEDIALLQKRVRDLEGNKTVIDSKDFLEKIQSNLENAGGIWSKKECKLLCLELEVAIKTIAKNHNRSVKAITSRIDKEQLLRTY